MRYGRSTACTRVRPCTLGSVRAARVLLAGQIRYLLCQSMVWERGGKYVYPGLGELQETSMGEQATALIPHFYCGIDVEFLLPTHKGRFSCFCLGVFHLCFYAALQLWMVIFVS